MQSSKILSHNFLTEVIISEYYQKPMFEWNEASQRLILNLTTPPKKELSHLYSQTLRTTLDRMVSLNEINCTIISGQLDMGSLRLLFVLFQGLEQFYFQKKQLNVSWEITDLNAVTLANYFDFNKLFNVNLIVNIP